MGSMKMISWQRTLPNTKGKQLKLVCLSDLSVEGNPLSNSLIFNTPELEGPDEISSCTNPKKMGVRLPLKMTIKDSGPVLWFYCKLKSVEC